MDKKKRIVFHLDTPFSAVSWPQIQPKNQDTILELLCSLLSPLGQYRSQHIHVSKGNRTKKRKRKERSDQAMAVAVPPAPGIQPYLDIGLSNVSRCLQKAVTEGLEISSSQDDQNSEQKLASRFYSVIFVARSGQPNALSSHLPQMVAVACKSHPSQPPTRLVELPKACEGRLCESLGIPRVSCIGICIGAPNSDALVDFAREHVGVITIPWLQEAAQVEYQATKINAVETTIGPRKKTTGKGIK
ncbi:putative RNase p and RNase mrp subunit [Rosellinia necatrix]|uniref:Putative RNase p and RNase mrp subunit n=1 Tax=Rosellinia necatrix TaxID=77044 RepID=A0A1W2TLU1_ROSNE|nr:putative RNase p and RNase mrp subunit [Rosellinia necatrix]